MIKTATYKVELRIDGTLIGDVRPLAQGLQWTRRRTRKGVDEISFTVNDVLFQEWCVARGTTIYELLKPLALDCRVIRDGEPIIGGYLATLPSYSPNGTSANLDLQFDGYLNYLNGVYMYPVGTQTGRMGQLVSNWIQLADTRATNAGKGFGFTEGVVSTLPSVTHTFDNYKAIKEAIADRCDNTTGAGPFDVYFHADRTYDIIGDNSFGDTITDYKIHYPAKATGVSAMTLSANEVGGFASSVIGIGSGEISSDSSKNTAITSVQTNSYAIAEFGYAESILQDSSVVQQSTLDTNTSTALEIASNPLWEPQVTLTGKQVKPQPTGTGKIWIGDRVTVNNEADFTGMTNGLFRVQELQVQVSATGAETITPVLERIR